MVRVLLVFLAIGVSLLVAGCGEGSSLGGTPTESPAVAPSRSPTASPGFSWEGNGKAKREVAYVDTGNSLWITHADGSEPRKIGDVACAGRLVAVSWAPTADRIGVKCFGRPSVMQIYDPDGGLVATIKGDAFTWSPAGTEIAIQTNEPSTPPVPRLSIVDLLSGQTEKLDMEAVLLGWPRANELLLGLNPVADPLSGAWFPQYDAAWYDRLTGETERLPGLDNGRQFWTAAGDDRAVVLTSAIDRPPRPGVGLAVYSLTTGTETPIPDAAIAYPSEGIPAEMLVVSSDTLEATWADWGAEPGIAIYQASLSGGGPSLIGRIDGLVVGLSDDELVLYNPRGREAILAVQDVESGSASEIGRGEIGAIALAR